MLVKKLLFSAAGVLAVVSAITAFNVPVIKSSQQNEIKHETAFLDLNKNGRMDVYEDAKQSIHAKINNLLIHIPIEEKAGVQVQSEKQITQSIYTNQLRLRLAVCC